MKRLLPLLFLLVLWQMGVAAFHVPTYLLPTPIQVFKTLWQQKTLLSLHSSITLLEILLGLSLGIVAGIIAASALRRLHWLRQWLLPLLVLSQAVPVFAIAPLLVYWLGYGIAVKILVVTLMLFFPVTSAFYDGLQQVPTAWADMATVMQASPSKLFWRLQLPAAAPALASGVRMAVVWAPIGAVMSEWVGASHGLGFLLLSANAQVRIDLVFATLLVLATVTVLLYFTVDKLLKRWIHW